MKQARQAHPADAAQPVAEGEPQHRSRRRRRRRPRSPEAQIGRNDDTATQVKARPGDTTVGAPAATQAEQERTGSRRQRRSPRRRSKQAHDESTPSRASSPSQREKTHSTGKQGLPAERADSPARREGHERTARVGTTRSTRQGRRPDRSSGGSRGDLRPARTTRIRPDHRIVSRGDARPRLPADGIIARSQHGDFGESWWAKRWIDVLESFGYGNRLIRGQDYARERAVLNIDVSLGYVTARVQGSRATPYRVSISVLPLSDAQWDRVIDSMADQAIFTARLLAGEMPREIEQAFANARVSLFPQSAHDLQTSCSCPDYAKPCKHIAAVYYLLGERFDEDPFLVFTLRGRSKERIIEDLRARRADTATEMHLPDTPTERVPALEDLMESFDVCGPEFVGVAPHIVAPGVASTMLRRYGPSPAETTNDLHMTYLLMTRAVLERLFADE
ncbi:SWIM zinc finger family protein [Candidatus Chloroploca asiatica]|uniref:SWIM-type domain-containing protein n=1 Tax=Candidatus Chloroploca asiatica TaxID=1506545 RepID=A0A2H3KN67_9CHLR|nr:SWIM zinc finger family protein [Candidatus Chloroploca asiatica]PDV99527.1 hypothetical protein A9Q02_12105 [Candidatus Chloroploca asiatica]